MTPPRRSTWPAPRFMPAACVAVCILCAAAGAAPQSQSQSPPARPSAQVPTPPSSAAAAPTTRPLRTPDAVRTPHPLSTQHPPNTQPAAAAVRPETTPDPIRRDLLRTPTARPTTGPTTGATAGATAKPPDFNLPRVLGALAIVLGLIFVLRAVLRRSMNPGSLPGATNTVQVLTRSPISPRQQLLLVRVGRRLLVVSDCNGQLNSLSEITDADEVASLVGQLRDEKLTSASRSFGNLLGMWRRGADAHDPDDDGAEATIGATAGATAGAEEFPRAAPEVPGRRIPGGALPGDREPGDSDDVEADRDDDPSVASARSELHGLMERVRSMSQQFKP